MSVPTLVTFVIYFILLLGIGFYFYRKSASIEDYLLGGRGMGAWVTALSAQASDMSGWLLMALPGAIYAYGMGKVWIPIGLFAGTVLNWKLVSGRLRVYTQKTDTITLPCFFEQRFGDPTGLLRIVSAIVILIFFTIYASSGLMATGKLFESTFGIQYRTAVIVGGGIIIAYTFLGGFLAVCWTDLFQGMLMVLALIIVPAVAYLKAGGMDAISEAMKLKQVSTSLLPAKGIAGLVAIISAMAWGLGYFGQPHILARFMSVKSVKKLPESMTIAIIWVFLSLAGAVIIGFVGIGMFENLSVEEGEHEKVFIYMIGEVMHPYVNYRFPAPGFIVGIDRRLLPEGDKEERHRKRNYSCRKNLRYHNFGHSLDSGPASRRDHLEDSCVCMGRLWSGFWALDTLRPVLPKHKLAIGPGWDGGRDRSLNSMEAGRPGRLYV